MIRRESIHLQGSTLMTWAASGNSAPVVSNCLSACNVIYDPIECASITAGGLPG